MFLIFRQLQFTFSLVVVMPICGGSNSSIERGAPPLSGLFFRDGGKRIKTCKPFPAHLMPPTIPPSFSFGDDMQPTLHIKGVGEGHWIVHGAKGKLTGNCVNMSCTACGSSETAKRVAYACVLAKMQGATRDDIMHIRDGILQSFASYNDGANLVSSFWSDHLYVKMSKDGVVNLAVRKSPKDAGGGKVLIQEQANIQHSEPSASCHMLVHWNSLFYKTYGKLVFVMVHFQNPPKLGCQYQRW